MTPSVFDAKSSCRVQELIPGLSITVTSLAILHGFCLEWAFSRMHSGLAFSVSLPCYDALRSRWRVLSLRSDHRPELIPHYVDENGASRFGAGGLFRCRYRCRMS